MVSPLAIEFAALVSPEIEDEQIDLLTTSLTIAKLEYPQLDVSMYKQKVSTIAETVKARVQRSDDSLETLAIINEVLFGDEDFRGNVGVFFVLLFSFFFVV